MIIFASRDVLQFTKDISVVNKTWCTKNCKVAKNLDLVHEYYGDMLKQKDVRPTNLADFEDIAKYHNVNIMFMWTKGGRLKDVDS